MNCHHELEPVTIITTLSTIEHTEDGMGIERTDNCDVTMVTPKKAVYLVRCSHCARAFLFTYDEAIAAGVHPL